ncbi:MAG TPA: alpha/beta hydrolase, partial [Patescibacteria group bacterium]|nr:alpha/beta hydrolase [Patescibacteria group bacterium]
PSHALNISDYVNILNRFYIKLKISKSILIGHSFGGKVAAEFAVRYPQKIEKLVLYSTDLTKKKSLFKKYLLILVNILSSRKMSFLIKLFLKKSKISYKNFLVLCKTYTDARLESKTSEKISRFNKPILYIYGKYDFLFPLSKVKLNLKKLSQVRVVEFEKSSHLAHLEEEKKFTKKLLEFIKLNK